MVFCSRRTRVADVEKLLADRCFSQAVVVRLPEGYQHPLLQFESSEFARTALKGLFINPNGDLSAKRNLGLLLARMVGWNRIFFMDDDVRDIAPDDLAATVSLLSRYRSVGLRVIDVPDNSVVCHAHRETGADQDVFVSGSALAVGSHEHMGFFPEIYNEDWFFFHNDVQGRRLGWSGRNASQLYYDPFGNAQRAARQEFGDILAEGLYTLLHLGHEKTAANVDFWKDFLDERRSFLQNILKRSKSVTPEVRGKMTEAVRTATKSLGQVEPWMCEEYIQAWGRDLKTWQQSLRSSPQGLPVDLALRQVGLSSAKGRKPVRPSSSPPAGTRRNSPARPASIPRVPTASLLQDRSNNAGRGRLRRSRVLGLPLLAGRMQRDAMAIDAGKEVRRADASAGAQPMPPDSLGLRIPATDLGGIADPFIAEDREALASP